MKISLFYCAEATSLLIILVCYAEATSILIILVCYAEATSLLIILVYYADSNSLKRNINGNPNTLFNQQPGLEQPSPS
jgi:hypothetical protein